MTRTGYDCIGANAQWVKDNLLLPDVMFFYDTGSGDIKWSPAQCALFPPAIMCSIDQGGPGSPIRGSRALDVETGAWSVESAIAESRSDPAHPALYGSRSTLSACAAAGYQGNFWLAWPGWTTEPLPEYPGITIVAVQDAWGAKFDHSVILVPSWPFGGTVSTPQPDMSVTVLSRTADVFFAIPAGADHANLEYETSGDGSMSKIRETPVNGEAQGIHMKGVSIPGATGGSLHAFAIVNGAAVPCGASNLP